MSDIIKFTSRSQLTKVEKNISCRIKKEMHVPQGHTQEN